VERYSRFLRERGLLDDEFVAATEAEAKQFGTHLRDGVIASGPRPVSELFEWVFAGELPPALARQRDEMLGDASDGDGGA
jgi:hypothetical protein